ncbi:MAG TPA: hypothetical protein VGG74_00785 [Kofleriaceae bacterium]
MKLGWLAIAFIACDTGTPPTTTTTTKVAPAPPVAAAPLPLPPVRPIAPSGEARTPLARVFPHADAAPGQRTRYRTAVILIAPARSAWNAEDSDAKLPRFVPLVCAIDGVIATGEKCGEVMPAHATIRTADGPLEVARSAKPFFDAAGEHVYPAPHGPTCCMYNTCMESTIPYTAMHVKRESGAPTKLGVWPADADVSLEVAGPGTNSTAIQAFARGARRYEARADGIWWNAGSGWAQANVHTMGNGEVLLATSDVDHDGTPELVAYELWANDYGIDVFATASLDPSYSFSCGNI